MSDTVILGMGGVTLLVCACVLICSSSSAGAFLLSNSNKETKKNKVDWPLTASGEYAKFHRCFDMKHSTDNSARECKDGKVDYAFKSPNGDREVKITGGNLYKNSDGLYAQKPLRVVYKDIGIPEFAFCYIQGMESSDKLSAVAKKATDDVVKILQSERPSGPVVDPGNFCVEPDKGLQIIPSSKKSGLDTYNPCDELFLKCK